MASSRAIPSTQEPSSSLHSQGGRNHVLNASIPFTTTKPKRGGRKTRFSKEDMETALTWLEHAPNFKSIFGPWDKATGGKNPPHSKSKTRAYSILAAVVSEQSHGRLNLNSKNMRERFERHLKVYTETKAAASLAAGLSGCVTVTAEDSRKGIHTKEEKLESICTCFARIDALFGGTATAAAANNGPLAQINPDAAANADASNGLQDKLQKSKEILPRHRRIIDEEEDDDEAHEADDTDEEITISGDHSSKETRQEHQGDINNNINTQDSNEVSNHLRHTRKFNPDDCDNDAYVDGENNNGNNKSPSTSSSSVTQQFTKKRRRQAESETDNDSPLRQQQPSSPETTDRQNKEPTTLLLSLLSLFGLNYPKIAE
ncbi:hypothetical protein BG004_000494, partial [Podila humilis]